MKGEYTENVWDLKKRSQGEIKQYIQLIFIAVKVAYL